MDKELKNHLAIKEWLELLKEDKNLCGAYISLSQYINITEQENTNLKQALNEIRKLASDYVMCASECRRVLQIIDKVLSRSDT